MKITSYLISKKLAEIGFRPDSIFYYNDHKELRWDDDGSPFPELCLRAYDLETVLEALPMGIDSILRYDLIIDQRTFIHYADCEGDELYKVMKKNDESLADTAARLLILLHEKGTINFNEIKIL